MQMNLEQCPTCGTELSQTKYREVRAKLKEQDEQKAREIAEAKLTVTREIEAEFKKKLEHEVKATEKATRAEASKQLDALTGKLKAAEVHAAELREQTKAEITRQRQLAEKDVRTEFSEQLKKLTLERDQAAQKAKAAAEEAQKVWQKELATQRAALERDKTSALLKQQSEHNRDRESLQKKVKTLEHQLEKKTANELGDAGEIDVFEALRDAYPTDKITRVQKGQPGADILHEVLYRGEVCGRIVTDSKVRQGWQYAYVTKLSHDRAQANADHAILATTVFPAGKKELCIESDVIVISPARVVYITQLLRQAIITMHIKGLSFKERSNKMTQLYSLITSQPYCKKFADAEKLAQSILDLDVQEKKDHDLVWRKRGAFATQMKTVLREIDTDVAAIVEGADASDQRMAS